MANLTQLNLNENPRDNKNANSQARSGSAAGPKTSTSATSRPRAFASKQKTMMFVALLLVATVSGLTLMGTSGCSKGSNKSAAFVDNQNSTNQTAPTSSTLSLPTAAAAVVTPKAPKKVVRKRPSTVTYKESAYGVSFRYPRKYALKTGDEAHRELAGIGPLPTNFVQPGGVSVATVEVPQNVYPETDFASAFFNVSVNRSLSSDECGQFALPVHLETEPLSAAKVKIGATQFDEVEDTDTKAPNQANAKYYHLFQNGACYEFALGLGTTGDDNAEVTPVDRAAVFGRLERILATVKIQPVAEPVVATSGQTPVADPAKN
jgi:hypothetical protein